MDEGNLVRGECEWDHNSETSITELQLLRHAGDHILRWIPEIANVSFRGKLLSSVPLTAEFRGSCGAQTASLTLAWFVWSGVPDDLTCFPLWLDLAGSCYSSDVG